MLKYNQIRDDLNRTSVEQHNKKGGIKESRALGKSLFGSSRAVSAVSSNRIG
ncbi:MAG: hypothetical protein Q4D65_07975 [Peptostreptococcaceae bacterium]|nr:hypothetical protein [Peptostreptococcaceae bacterium]